MSGRSPMTLSAHTSEPPMPTFFSTCWKCVLTALNTIRNCRSTCTASSCAWSTGPASGRVTVQVVAPEDWEHDQVESWELGRTTGPHVHHTTDDLAAFLRQVV